MSDNGYLLWTIISGCCEDFGPNGNLGDHLPNHIDERSSLRSKNFYVLVQVHLDGENFLTTEGPVRPPELLVVVYCKEEDLKIGCDVQGNDLRWIKVRKD